MKLKPYDGEYHVYMVNFKCGAITGAIREDENGFATIYINDQCGPQGRKRAFLHELKHKQRNDLYTDAPIDTIEP